MDAGSYRKTGKKKLMSVTEREESGRLLGDRRVNALQWGGGGYAGVGWGNPRAKRRGDVLEGEYVQGNPEPKGSRTGTAGKVTRGPCKAGMRKKGDHKSSGNARAAFVG